MHCRWNCNIDKQQLLSNILSRFLARSIFLFLFLPFILTAQPVSQSTIVQCNVFKTGVENAIQLPVPSIDPAGITYHAPTGHLFIVDSEIEEVPEMWDQIQANVFEVSLDGKTLYNIYNLQNETLTGANNREPSGIAYSEYDGYFYIVNDDEHTIYRYERVRDGDRYVLQARDRVNVSLIPETADMKGDLEGVAVDPSTGLIYVVDGFDAEIAVFKYTIGFEFVRRISVLLEADKRLRDPEGIAVNPVNNHLFVVSSRKDVIVELTNDGRLIKSYSSEYLEPKQKAIQGLTFAPSSHPTVELSDGLHLYIADGRVDNAVDSGERDGVVYEVFVAEDAQEAERKRSEIARKYALQQNFPNPFNANTNITFTLFEDANVDIKLYNIRGEEIRSIANTFFTAGAHTILFQSNNLPTGVYYYKMRVQNSVQTKALVLLK